MRAPFFFLFVMLCCLLTPAYTFAAAGPEANAASSSAAPAAAKDASSPAGEQTGQTLVEGRLPPPAPADYGLFMAQAVDTLLYPKKAAASSPAGAVRNHIWGAPFATVKKRESLSLDEAIEPFILSYAVPQQSGSLYLLYVFDEKKALAETTCFINIPRGDNEAYMEDYEQLAKGFTALYGAPGEPTATYADNKKTAAPDNLMEAIENGESKLVTRWNVSPTTTMNLVMSGEEAGIILFAQFLPQSAGNAAP